MRRRLFFLAVLLVFLPQTVLWAAMHEKKKNGKRFYAEEDKKGDGKIDTWYYYNADGKLLQKAHDSNGDGKPDQFSSFIHGDRNFMLREEDRNFDGKIDRRVFGQWDPNKSIPIVTGTRITRIPNPGYATLWQEADDNFDGIIDVYRERQDKNKTSTKTKVGQKMDPRPMQIDQSESAITPSKSTMSGESQDQRRIDELNEKNNLGGSK